MCNCDIGIVHLFYLSLVRTSVARSIEKFKNIFIKQKHPVDEAVPAIFAAVVFFPSRTNENDKNNFLHQLNVAIQILYILLSFFCL